MTSELKNKWIDALRSGKYKQGQGQLCIDYSLYGNQEGPKLYCCLGVLCEVAHMEYCKNQNQPFPYQLDLLGLQSEDATLLIQMNDGYLDTFEEIADYIEEKL